jgi:hypothetical protein
VKCFYKQKEIVVNKSFKNLLLSSIIAGTSFSAFAAGPDISGYFDVAFLAPKDKSTYFHQQHLNLLLQHQVDKFKFFSELEFEDTPNMDYGRVPDATTIEGKGRLFLERAYGEYAASQFVNVRMGQMLTSTHYYLNHYPSIIVNYTNPLTLKTIFNYNEMGVQFFGEYQGFRYDAWTGKGPNTSKQNPGQNESGTNYGGKLSYSYNSKVFNMTFAVIGESYAMGDQPSATQANIDNGTANSNAKKSNMAMGAEFVMNYDAFTLWAEYGTREGKDLKGLNDKVSGSNKLTGYYLQGSYAVSLGKHGEIIPFVMIDGLKYKDGFDGLVEAKNMTRTILGLAYRPVPTITWKLEYTKCGSYVPKNADGTLYHIADANYLEDKVVAQFVYFYN